MKRGPLRVVGLIARVVVAALALVVGGAVLFLHTRAGGDFIRRRVVAGIDGGIRGQLSAERLRLVGDQVRLGDIELKDPEGQLVARLPEVEVEFSPLALLRGRIVLSRVEVIRPELRLRVDRRGLNLARALAPRHPPAEAEPDATDGKSPSRLSLEVTALQVLGGVVDYHADATAAEPRHARLEDLNITARASLRLDGARFDAGLDGAARVIAPAMASNGPLAVQVSARGERAPGAGDALAADLGVELSIGPSALQATGHLGRDGTLAVDLRRLHVDPRLAVALRPSLGLRAPVDVSARLSRSGPLLTIDRLRVVAGGGRVEAQGGVDLGARRARGVAVDAHDIDLGAILDGWPRSSLSLALRADGGGPSLDRLDGTLSLVAPAGRLDGGSVGPVRLSARAQNGRLEVSPFLVTLPGLGISGEGTSAIGGRLDAHVDLHASDLARTARGLRLGDRVGAPAVAGRGDVAIRASGTLDALAVEARGRFASLAVAEQRVRDLVFAVKLPDLRHPDRVEATVQSGGALVGGRALAAVRADLRAGQRAISADVQIDGGKTLALSVRGRWTHARRAAVIESLSLTSGSARWVQSGPIDGSFGGGSGGRFALRGLDLRSGSQRLRAEARGGDGEPLAGHLDVERLDLAQLPRPLLPPSVPALGGHLDLHVDLDGTARRPALAARADLSGGRFGRYRGLTLTLDGRYAADRARATLSAAGLGATVHGRFDLPVRWPVRDARAPVSADLQIVVADLGGALALFQPGRPPSLAGRLAATVRLDGLAGDPSLVLNAQANGLRAPGSKVVIGDVVLAVEGRAGAPFKATLRLGGATAGGGLADGVLSVETPLSLRALARGQWPPRRDWLATPFVAHGDLQRIGLGQLAAIARRPGGIGGQAAVRLDLRGTARSPEGALNLILSGAHGARFPETDLRVDAAFHERDVRVAAQVARRQHLLAWASAVAELPAARLGDLEALASAPLHVRAGLGPVDLRQTPFATLAGDPNQPPAATSKTPGGDDGPLRGRARIDLEIEGTARQPVIHASADLRELKQGTAAEAGAARLALTYADRRAALDARLTAVAGGDAVAHAATSIDLGYPALGRTTDVARLPIDVSFDASALDLGWLSGIAAPIRTVGGKLTASLRAHGTMAAPTLAGKLEWRDGALALAGLGGYRGIHLTAHGDEQTVYLDALDARSREGSAHLSGSLGRTKEGAGLRLVAKVDRFPVYAQGELMAQVSLDASVRAAIARGRADGTLTIGELRAELAQQPKDLQSLARPGDIVLVSGGRPIDRAEARKLGRLRADRRQAAAADAAAGAAAATPAQMPFAARVAVDAPRNLWLRGKDADLEVGLERGFRIEVGDELLVYGAVDLERGHVDLLGRRLVLQSGSTARFAGPPGIPIIDVTAKYVDDRDNLTVLLHAAGPIDKLKVDVTAPDHPGLTETQLYTVIIVGHLQSGGDSGGGAAAAVSSEALSSEAGSLVAGVLASQLQKVLSKRLPLDVLSIQTGTGLSGSRLEAGKYISSDVYVGYVGRSGANPALLQNRNAVHLEYQISSRWSFDAEYGDAGTGTADLMWTKRY